MGGGRLHLVINKEAKERLEDWNAVSSMLSVNEVNSIERRTYSSKLHYKLLCTPNITHT